MAEGLVIGFICFVINKIYNQCTKGNMRWPPPSPKTRMHFVPPILNPFSAGAVGPGFHLVHKNDWLHVYESM